MFFVHKTLMDCNVANILRSLQSTFMAPFYMKSFDSYLPGRDGKIKALDGIRSMGGWIANIEIACAFLTYRLCWPTGFRSLVGH